MKNTIRGRIKACQSGHGFLESEYKKYFIPKSQMAKVLNEDLIEGVLHKNSLGKINFIPKNLIEHRCKFFMATVKSVHGHYCFVEPQNPKSGHYHYMPCSNISLEIGDLVHVKVVKHPFNGKSMVVLDQLLCRKSDPDYPWVYATSIHSIDYSNLHGYTKSDIYLPKNDLSSDCFLTIDSCSTKDIDDAVTVSYKNDCYELKVAIADPSQSAMPGSKWFEIAKDRAFTFYSPGKSVSMLPKNMSDNVFSLIKNEKRPALVCTITISKDGEIKKYKFQYATIISKATLNYNSVNMWLSDKEGAIKSEPSEIKNILSLLNDLHDVRIKNKKTLPSYFSDGDYFYRVKDFKLVEITKESKTRAHSIIEEAMVLANICGANFVTRHSLSAVFMSNSGFDVKKLSEVSQLANEEGLEFSPDKLSTIDGFYEFNECVVRNKNLFNKLKQIKPFAQTVIGNKATPHLMLGVEEYLSWTSPIRKFGDLVNHIVIKGILQGHKTTDPLINTITLSSIYKKRKQHRLASKAVKEELFTQYLISNNDQPYIGTVKGACAKGVFIEFDYSGLTYLALNTEYSNRVGDEIEFNILTVDTFTKEITVSINEIVQH